MSKHGHPQEPNLPFHIHAKVLFRKNKSIYGRYMYVIILLCLEYTENIPKQVAPVLVQGCEGQTIPNSHNKTVVTYNNGRLCQHVTDVF